MTGAWGLWADGGGDVCKGEVSAFEQEGLPRGLGQGVGEAVAEV